MSTRTETGRLSSVAAIARHEVRAGLRGRMIPAFGVLFAALTVGITLAGLGASGQLLVQGFERTSVSVLTLAVYLLPLIGVIMGAAAFGGEDGGTELLLAQPLGRTDVILGRVLGLSICLAIVAICGFGSAAAVVIVATGPHGLGGYLFVSFVTTAVGFAALFAGIFIGVIMRRRTAAVGWALAAWFAAAVLYDLASIMILQLTGSGHPGPVLVTLLSVNPIDGARVLALQVLGADVLLGPTGAALKRSFGDWGAGWIAISMVAWMILSLGAAGRVYGRRDF